MKEIVLTRNQIAIVDDDDCQFLMGFIWKAVRPNNVWYAHTKYGTPMHRLLFHELEKSLIIDHIDGNGLNNQRSNLRIVTKSQNAMNMGAHLDNITGYKGVCFNRNFKSKKKYSARISHMGTVFNLGVFLTPEEAAIAYNKKAFELHGEFARLNEV